ncbi:MULTISPECIES: 50S ribosomal protein L18Ae [Haloferax]|uniref:Large ribosomal subunit protein eL20 n=2 Tax=Haloferax TaxID=2251 RepID=A0A6A8GDL8_9EURY|nr:MULTISPECIES: 50S ribosomal protein L18Ae [Haloferax]KAB1192775.1 50S ribosomal protein L18a [Haloferax sp. CBA1148]KTG29337.1 50S ribosomal protein LX [Haloferax profundi]MRX21258.1 50S ribosomal protein L18a [Haloferax litoreum]
MSQFTISGRFTSRGVTHEFTKTVDAPNENVARERAFSLIGSEHGIKRTKVDLTEVSAA